MKKLLANLSLAQRLTVLAVALAAAGGIYALIHYQKEADFKPLFTGVAPEDAAPIVQKLRESGIEYRLPEGGGSVLVPSAHLAELRLTMAAAGLPKTGRIGFELFDKTNLGATEFTEHINYRRALEGELERSVMSLAEVEQARVHLTFPKDSVFLDSQQPAKASVLVKVRPHAQLAAGNVVAISNLVASAVEGLAPGAVSVLDMNGNLLSRPKEPSADGGAASDGSLDYRRQIETDLLAKINSTLEPLLGANKFRAGVSVDCDFAGGELSEEVFDPSRSVMASSQRTEDTAGSAGASGVPGTASTLPHPAGKNGAGPSNRVTRMTENITYQTTRTVKKTRVPSGTVKKISLAVLVDNELTWQQEKTGFKRVLAPPTPEKLKVIHDLVAGITGFNAERGDQLVVESLPFENTLTIEPPEAAKPITPKPQGPMKWPPDRNTLLIGAGAAALLIGAGFLAAMMLRSGRRKATASTEKALPPGDAGHAGADGDSGVSIEKQLESKLAERDAMQAQLEAQALKSLQIAPVITKTAEILAKHLREKIKHEPEVSAQVLRTWINEGEN
ncbi:MAG: flagellar basal-body MS-ring/collar protein FliF [Bryobacteraceae bacterium]